MILAKIKSKLRSVEQAAARRATAPAEDRQEENEDWTPGKIDIEKVKLAVTFKKVGSEPNAVDSSEVDDTFNCLWDKAFLPCDIVDMLNANILTDLLTEEQKKKKLTASDVEALMSKTLLSDGVTFAMLRASQEEVTYI